MSARLISHRKEWTTLISMIQQKLITLLIHPDFHFPLHWLLTCSFTMDSTAAVYGLA